MKQFLYMAILLICCLIPFTKGNTVQAQNMASEIVPWDIADKNGGVCYCTKCDYCGEWLVYFDENEENELMSAHIKDKHPNFDINNNGEMGTPGLGGDSNGGTDNGSNESGNNTSSNDSEGPTYYPTLVNIDAVAETMAAITQDDYNFYLDDFRAVLHIDENNNANANDVAHFINKWYYTIKNKKYDEAIKNNYPVMMFVRPSSGEVYDVITNYHFHQNGKINFDYYFVFPKIFEAIFNQ